MTAKSIYQKPVAEVLITDCDEILCSSPVGSGASDVSVTEGWEWDED